MTQDKLRNFIKELRYKFNLKYTDIAKDLEISSSYLSKWLRNERNFSVNLYYKVLEYCNTKYKELNTKE